MITDPIADALSRIRNSLALKYKNTEVSFSKIVYQIIQLLYNIGYLKDYKIFIKNKKKIILVSLKYDKHGLSVIKGIKKVSKPSLRVYVKAKNIPIIYNGIGTSILTTSMGLATTFKAKRKNIGGEIICHIW
jgi:small subunit ribosomal protein S8